MKANLDQSPLVLAETSFPIWIGEQWVDGKKTLAPGANTLAQDANPPWGPCWMEPSLEKLPRWSYPQFLYWAQAWDSYTLQFFHESCKEYSKRAHPVFFLHGSGDIPILKKNIDTFLSTDLGHIVFGTTEIYVPLILKLKRQIPSNCERSLLLLEHENQGKLKKYQGSFKTIFVT